MDLERDAPDGSGARGVKTICAAGPSSVDGLLVVEPQPGIEMHDWAADRAAALEDDLRAHGAILFRGVRLEGTEDLESFARLFCSELFDGNGEHPRTASNRAVYTPTFYPEGRKLLWHHENSFNRSWPLKILFGCLKPADTGGETPIADSRQVYRRLDASIRRRFEDRGVMYVRNYHANLGLDWQTVFQTTSAGEVEARCRQEGMLFEWTAEGALRTRWIRPATVTHPVTGEASWFNQAQHWHPACLDPRTRETMMETFAPEDFPRHCYYGDGTPIDDAVMTAILDLYQDLEITFAWRRGDVLLLDNVSVAHARNPYSGERKLLVAMGEMRTFTPPSSSTPD